jgi:hypothetical protein
LADVYHSENIDKISDDLIAQHHIPAGTFDNIAACSYRIPTHWDIGKVYKRLIAEVCNAQGKTPVKALIEVYNSWMSRALEDYNSSLFYENPDYIYSSYSEGKILE